ncbi:E3 SUMO-protein ligase RanBP2-like [Contarinia nasturtii]|uniref:E3 SUMO-protein ligase RanBP2-like n=1 Tax=Contarinia nasturtii TaxID=265458 RepID=UPI0012D3742C|nr:E3 SUMO-protein ligase RanBP2-like [Contarinia nasturtii]
MSDSGSPKSMRTTQHYCPICLKSIGNQENLNRHVEVLHSEKTVLYVCPICNLGLRWAKNFPTHGTKYHGMTHQDGLNKMKSLQIKVVDNSGYMGSAKTITTQCLDDNVPKDENIPLKKRKIDFDEQQTENDNIRVEKYVSPENVSPKNVYIDANSIFNARIDILSELSKWECGSLSLLRESSDPIMIRLVLMIGDQVQWDELLTVQTKFQMIKKTEMKWTGEDFSRNYSRMMETVVRFKLSKVRDKFFNVWSEVEKTMMEQLKTKSSGAYEEEVPMKTELNNFEQSFTASSEETTTLPIKSVDVKWTCTLCDESNTGYDCKSCGEFQQILPSTPKLPDTSQLINHSTTPKKLAPFQLINDSNKNRTTSNAKEKTILFDHKAKLYRFEQNNWEEHGIGNIKILGNSYDNTLQLLMHSESDLTLVCNQTISKHTLFDEAKIEEGVITWMGHESGDSSEEQWALTFDVVSTCKKFNNIILVVTTATEKLKSDTMSTESMNYMDHLITYWTTDTPEDFKNRFWNTYKTMKTEQLSRDIQTWNDMTIRLDIRTEGKMRFFEDLCQNLNQRSSSHSTDHSSIQ